MKSLFKLSGRMLLTAAMAACALVLGLSMWNYYMEAPWTRDGHLRADVVSIAPDVSGLVSKVFVADNAEVKKGDPLFQIDEQRFKLALRQAEAQLDSAKAALEYAKTITRRYRKLATIKASSQQDLDEALAQEKESQASYTEALADRDVARLNLKRSTVLASATGKVTNLSLRPGDYATAGSAVAALVETESFYVAGYFEETKLPRIHMGDPVLLTFMGTSQKIRGKVVSIAAGIQDSERSDTAGSLPSVTATFNWVRLAQRVPVRIELEDIPATFDLVSGRSVTVEVLQDANAKGTTLSWNDFTSSIKRFFRLG